MADQVVDDGQDGPNHEDRRKLQRLPPRPQGIVAALGAMPTLVVGM